MFKTKCITFLDGISEMRNQAIEKKVQEALETEHKPYVEELQKAKEAVIAEDTRKAEAMIKAIREELNAKVHAHEEKARLAIQKDKERVETKARESACAQYDNFILSVSRLVDKTQLN